ncbi:MAG: hypothetical protein AB8B87_24685 [Granulosicoccus sp.]
MADGVVLDLKYEARTVPQRLSSADKIDEWFTEKNRGLNGFQQAVLRKRWATMEKLMSSAGRKDRIVASIVHDFGIKPRLNNNRGTAILVAASIYDACHYYRLVRESPLGKKSGIVTSFEPNANKISKEEADSDERYKFDTYNDLVLAQGQTTKQYEDAIKKRFIEEPANCKLLIVVSKLLTGFDAPSCTYIYLDNELRDHNLFQAICRTNRLDGNDKHYGYIVDFKEMFNKVQESIAVYTSDELDVDESDGSDGNVKLKDWLKEGKKKLDETREVLHYLCEPVEPPKELEQYLHYFCGKANETSSLDDTEALRMSFYKTTIDFIRAYADVATDLEKAGYSSDDIAALKRETDWFTDIRQAIKQHAAEELDIKPYEADMRHLINTYVQAEDADILADLGSVSLVELIIRTGIHDAIAKKLNQQGKLSNNSVAEGIINNVRKTIIRDQLTDPRFYAKMSELLDDLIRQQRDDTDAYEQFLIDAEALVRQMNSKDSQNTLPVELKDNPEAAAVYNNLPSLGPTDNEDDAGETAPEYPDSKLALAMAIDKAMREQAPADWKGDSAREGVVKNVLFPMMGRDREATEAIF